MISSVHDLETALVLNGVWRAITETNKIGVVDLYVPKTSYWRVKELMSRVPMGIQCNVKVMNLPLRYLKKYEYMHYTKVDHKRVVNKWTYTKVP
ncbi:hypothetical protein AP1_0157 [Aeromonas phage AP1]|nr:hypothetical protein AP1_0157 [Aeromonas phage AP1]